MQRNEAEAKYEGVQVALLRAEEKYEVLRRMQQDGYLDGSFMRPGRLMEGEDRLTAARRELAGCRRVELVARIELAEVVDVTFYVEQH